MLKIGDAISQRGILYLEGFVLRLPRISSARLKVHELTLQVFDHLQKEHYVSVAERTGCVGISNRS